MRPPFFLRGLVSNRYIDLLSGFPLLHPHAAAETAKFLAFNNPRPIEDYAACFKSTVRSRCSGVAVFAVGGYAFGSHSAETVREFGNGLAQEIGAADVTIAGWDEWTSLMPKIACAFSSGRLLVLVGYSLGNSALVGRILPVLYAAGVPVTAWVMLDAGYLRASAFPAPFIQVWSRNPLAGLALVFGIQPFLAIAPPVPENVRWILNVESDGPFAGRKLEPADFLDRSGAERQIYLRRHVGHAPLPEDGVLRTEVAQLLKKVLLGEAAGG